MAGPSWAGLGQGGRAGAPHTRNVLDEALERSPGGHHPLSGRPPGTSPPCRVPALAHLTTSWAGWTSGPADDSACGTPAADGELPAQPAQLMEGSCGQVNPWNCLGPMGAWAGALLWAPTPPPGPQSTSFIKSIIHHPSVNQPPTPPRPHRQPAPWRCGIFVPVNLVIPSSLLCFTSGGLSNHSLAAHSTQCSALTYVDSPSSGPLVASLFLDSHPAGCHRSFSSSSSLAARSARRPSFSSPRPFAPPLVEIGADRPPCGHTHTRPLVLSDKGTRDATTSALNLPQPTLDRTARPDTGGR